MQVKANVVCLASRHWQKMQVKGTSLIDNAILEFLPAANKEPFVVQAQLGTGASGAQPRVCRAADLLSPYGQCPTLPMWFCSLPQHKANERTGVNVIDKIGC